MSGARPDTWMPLYWGDYLRDTMHLRTEGHGAYLLLIGAYWTSGEPLPDDDDQLSAITRLDVRAWNRLRPTLARFFTIADGLWRHSRIDAELWRASSITEARRKAGKIGGKRRSKREANDESNEKQKATQSQSYTESSLRSDSCESRASPKRGTRLSHDWAPDEDICRQAMDEFGATAEEVDHETAQFRDYWTAKAGRDAIKLDWRATWRGWLRRAAIEYGRIGRNRQQKGSGSRVVTLPTDERRRRLLAAGGFEVEVPRPDTGNGDPGAN